MSGTLHPADLDEVTSAYSYTGRLLRHLLNAWQGRTALRPFGARSGVDAGTDSSVVAVTSTSWTVHPCSGVLDVETSSLAGPYRWEFSVDQTSPAGQPVAADGSNQRVDSLCVQMNDPAEDGSGDLTVDVVYTAGIAGAPGGARGAAGGPPAVPSHSVEIAQITVPQAGFGSPTVSWVAPWVVALGGVTPVRSGQAMPASPYTGEHADAVDMGGGVRWNGTAWVSSGMGVATITDWNTATGPGMYYAAAGASNSPNSSNAYVGQTVRNPASGGLITQVAWRISSTATAVEQWQRNWTGSSWGAWMQTGYTDTGTVSNAGGGDDAIMAHQAAGAQSIQSYNIHALNGMVFLTCDFKATAQTIGTSGDITNTAVVKILDSRFVPAHSWGLHSGNTGRVASYVIGSDGTISLTAVGGSANIAAGDALTVAGAYPLG